MPHRSHIHLQQAGTEVALNNSPTQMCLASFHGQNAVSNWGHGALGFVPERAEGFGEVKMTVTFPAQLIFRNSEI